jgi:hypothetical protein
MGDGDAKGDRNSNLLLIKATRLQFESKIASVP